MMILSPGQMEDLIAEGWGRVHSTRTWGQTAKRGGGGGGGAEGAGGCWALRYRFSRCLGATMDTCPLRRRQSGTTRYSPFTTG